MPEKQPLWAAIYHYHYRSNRKPNNETHFYNQFYFKVLMESKRFLFFFYIFIILIKHKSNAWTINGGLENVSVGRD